ncbi:MAG TPA: 4-hydroxy-tetrahydrodipicolinate reductase [Actinomycetales bacterium]|nr:4-hydroxy-tetrahydrodipicolinate reductase [Actinomycetales bacterium]
MPAPTLAVAVVGASGRMGSETCRAVEDSGDMALVGAFGRGDDLGDLAGASVAVDFSVPSATLDVVLHCVRRGVHVVVGTTGWDDDRLAQVKDALQERPGVGVLVAPNFSVGAVLMMRFAAQAARFYESVEVVELHHPDKVDAPSGTATRTAHVIGQARRAAGAGPVPDATASDPGGARGAVVDGIHVHSVRLRGLVAHEEVLLGSPGEQLTLRHDSFERAAFVPGILSAVRAIAARPGLTVGLEHVLDLP